MLVEHPEDLKEITDRLEAEEAKKRRTWKIIVPLIILAIVPTFIGLFCAVYYGVPAIMNANRDDENVFKVYEGGELQETHVWDLTTNSWNISFSGFIQNTGKQRHKAEVRIHLVYENADDNRYFTVITEYVESQRITSYIYQTFVDKLPSDQYISLRALN